MNALDFFISIKTLFILKYSESDLWKYDKTRESCVEYWARTLQVDEFADIVEHLIIRENGDLILFRYQNPYETGFWHKYDGLFMECRSVVINIKKNEFVITPFRKFHNILEREENSIENIQDRIANAEYVEFAEKLDGSMQCARYYNGKIVMSSSQSLSEESSWRLEDGRKMFEAKKGYFKMCWDNEDLTFIFEYISKKDAHIVKYENEGLYLIGIRDVKTGYEYPYCDVLFMASKYKIPATKIYHLNLDDVMSSLDSKLSSEAEGFVLNIDGYKVKIKYNDYVNMHKTFSFASMSNIVIKAIADGMFDDFISKVPETYKERIMEVACEVRDYVSEMNRQVFTYYHTCVDPNSGIAEVMSEITKNVPQKYQSYVRNLYLRKPFNYLKTNSGRYIKYKEIINE